MSTLRISLIQSTLHWEAVDENLNTFDQKLKPLAGKTDLIILPEMFTTGFSMNVAEVAETMEGKTIEWLKNQAVSLQAAITGSFIAKTEAGYFNRLVFMYPDGNFSTYDKRHLFTLAKEHHTYQSGQERLLVEWKGWKICPLICYDLRFPVWSRNNVGYDLLIYVANWPQTRSLHWKSLLQARAIENQAFTIGVNRVGEDQKGLIYSGDSTFVDYTGTVLYQVSYAEDIFTTILDQQKQSNFRSKLNFLPDQDAFQFL